MQTLLEILAGRRGGAMTDGAPGHHDEWRRQ